MASVTLEQNAIINEFLDVIEANDMIGDLQNKYAGYEFYIVTVMFHFRIVHHQRILMSKSGLC